MRLRPLRLAIRRGQGHADGVQLLLNAQLHLQQQLVELLQLADGLVLPQRVGARPRDGGRAGGVQAGFGQHLLIEPDGAARWADAQLLLQRLLAAAVLAQRLGAVAGQVVQADEAAMGALAGAVVAQGGDTVGDARLILPWLSQ